MLWSAVAPMPALAVDNVLELIGNTPLVRLGLIADASSADVLCKCEQFNPGGSVKDRIALAMIEAAEREGRIKPGELGDRRADLGQHRHRPGAGVRGQGLPLVLTMPESMSLERRSLLKAYGAELILTPAERTMEGAVDARRGALPQEPEPLHAAAVQQPGQPRGAPAHHRRARLLAQLGDARLRRVRRRRRHRRHHHRRRRGASARSIPACRSSPSSRRRRAVLSGGPVGPHKIQGIGAGFVPTILNRTVIDEVRKVSDRDAYETKVRLAKEEGLLVGISSGANACVALRGGARARPRQARRHRHVRHRRALLLARRVLRMSAWQAARARHRRGRPRLPGAARAGARRGARRIGIVDDDRVDVSNLHRQILSRDDDVGRAQGRRRARARCRGASRR